MNLKSGLWLGIALFLVGDTPSSRAISGSIDATAEWSGNVQVTDTVIVAADVTLKILPGTHVRFSRDAGLVVRGQLLAEADENQPIVFERAEDVEENRWLGIIIDPDDEQTAPSMLAGCQIRGPTNGVTLKGNPVQPHRVIDCVISGCHGTGIRLQGVTGAVIEENKISACGASGESPSAGIWADDGRSCVISGNTIENCARYGILLQKGDLNTIKGNSIRGIGGKAMSTEGMGIVTEQESSRNLILSNTVTGCNYNGIAIYSRDNQVIDNDVGNSPDGIGLAGAASTGNIVRDNRISRGWWSTMYVTSTARDNFFYNNVVEGGDGGITTRAAGPNLWENCRFYNHNSQGSLALLGTGIATFRRCSIKSNGPQDLQLEYGSYARVIDCDFSKDRIAFGAGTGDHNYVEWLHTATFLVCDAADDLPLAKATVEMESTGTEHFQTSQSTAADGKASLEVLETIIRKDGLRDAGPYRATVRCEGFEPVVLSDVEVKSTMKMIVSLRKLP